MNLGSDVHLMCCWKRARWCAGVPSMGQGAQSVGVGPFLRTSEVGAKAGSSHCRDSVLGPLGEGVQCGRCNSPKMATEVSLVPHALSKPCQSPTNRTLFLFPMYSGQSSGCGAAGALMAAWINRILQKRCQVTSQTRSDKAIHFLPSFLSLRSFSLGTWPLCCEEAQGPQGVAPATVSMARPGSPKPSAAPADLSGAEMNCPKPAQANLQCCELNQHCH